MSELDLKFRRPDSTIVSVRLSTEESKILTAAAREAGEKLSTYIRHAALAAAKPTSLVVREHVGLGGNAAYRVVMGDRAPTVDAPHSYELVVSGGGYQSAGSLVSR